MPFQKFPRRAPKTRSFLKSLCLWAVLLTGALLPACAKCAKALDLRVSIPIAGEDSPRIDPFVYGNNHYLFLPGFCDRERLVAHVGKNGDACWEIKEGGELTGGELTGAFAADRLTLRSPSAGWSRLQVMQGSKIPSLFVTTQSGSVSLIHKSKNNREPGHLLFVDADGIVRYNGELSAIRTRGNTTAGYPKRPYQIKLADAANLTGSGECKTFVLLAEYLDFSLLRNRVTLDMARYAQLPCAVRALSVDLYVNGAYRGVYTLADKVEIGKNRVVIKDLQPEMEYLNDQPLSQYKGRTLEYEDGTTAFGYRLDASPADVTGGYLLEIDKAYRVRNAVGGSVFTRLGMGLTVREPEYPSMEQMEYLHGLLIGIDNSIRQEDGVDPVSGAHFSQLIDLPSFAKKFLIEDISLNFDAKAGSQYFFKDRDSVSSKLFAGPAWDYDLTYGNCLIDDPGEPYLMTMRIGFPWYNTLFRKQAQFRREVQNQYFTYFQPALQILTGQRQSDAPDVLRSLAQYQEEVSRSAEMNAVRWPPKYGKQYSIRNGYNFHDSIKYMNSFLLKRMAFMDGYLGDEANIR